MKGFGYNFIDIYASLYSISNCVYLVLEIMKDI